MSGAALAALSGVCFGFLVVIVGFGLRAGVDSDIGALVMNSVALLAAGVAVVIAGDHPLAHLGSLWPYVLVGVLVPGASQPFYVRAVGSAGASRTAMVISVSPLLSAIGALAFLGEPLKVGLAVGTVLIVLAGITFSAERVRPKDFRGLGVVFALMAAALYAARDNIVRWSTSGTAVPAFVGMLTALVAAVVVLSLYTVVAHRAKPVRLSRRGIAYFSLAGIALGFAYVTLFLAFNHSRVTVVAPLTATSSLWALVLAGAVARTSEAINPRLIAAILLVAAGGVLIGITR